MPVQRIAEFDVWKPGYGAATVYIYRAGTTDLASIYTDEALSLAAANPQTLLSRDLSGISYGKFSAPLYTEQAYELLINSVDQTGAQRPALLTLSGADASEALVTVDGGSQAIALEDHLARRIDVRDFGVFLAVGEAGASSSTNAATLAAAVGAAGANGGGFVELPAGTYQITTLSLSAGVVLRGQGRNATIIQSTYAGNVVTAQGDRCGLSRMTLDGVSTVALSVGLYSVAKDELVFDDAEIKRFATGLDVIGGENMAWEGLFVSTCSVGVHLRGDSNSGGGTAGKKLRQVAWIGGAVSFNTTAGVKVENVDDKAELVSLEHVHFDTNTGKALHLVGARNVRVANPAFVGNTTNIEIEDGDPETTTNTVADVKFEGGLISGGAVNLKDTLFNVSFERTEFADVDITLTQPSNNVVAIDCREDALTTIGGTATAWVRQEPSLGGASFGLTTGNAATKAWALTLQPGERAYLEAKVIAKQRNGLWHGFWHLLASVQRPPAELDYDTQTGNFTVGDVLTGATSGATARIVGDTDGGTTGTLRLQDIVGTFEDNEIIEDDSTGSATANGAVTTLDMALIGTVQTIRRTYPQAQLAYDAQSANFTVGLVVTGGTSGATGTILSDTDGGTSGALTLTDVTGTFLDNEALTDSGSGAAVVNGVLSSTKWDATFVANGPEIELRVTGDTSQTVEWTVDVEARRA